MTKILAEVKTYSLVNGDMVHTGYFIATNNYRLKQIFKSSWDAMKGSPTFSLDIDHILRGLQDAQ